MKNKETLGEAAEKSAIEQMEAGNSAYILGFIQGVKHQQEQDKKLYSEEDMIEFADFYYQYKELIKLQKWEIIEISKKDVFKKWFEQFKK